jgi:DNA repair protein SbcC/Rad50
MVPCRIQLRGFLSFRDEQSLEFADAPLWMLAGPNGSGKSAVFDGVTYALFGWHRGGAKDAGELVNKECDGFSVEFEFTLGDERFLIRRTHKRRARGAGASTQQILQWIEGRWIAVAETSQSAQFKAWVDAKIGLKYDTFTSSVLLLQGQAEKLLGKGPADRFKVLSDIVDLERYSRLHERVDQARRDLRSKCEVVRNQIAGVSDVTADQIESAQAAVALAEGERSQNQTNIESLIAVEHEAKRFAELTAQSDATRAKRAQAESLLADAVAIERDATRLAELDRVIPLAETALRERAGVEDSERLIAGKAAEQETTANEVRRVAAAIDQARAKRTALQAESDADDGARAALDKDMKELVGSMTLLGLIETNRAELQQLETEVARFPVDLPAQIMQAEAAVGELETAKRALPVMTRIARQRTELIAGRRSRLELAEQFESITKTGQQLAAEVTRLEECVEKKKKEVEVARSAATSAQTILREAESDLKAVLGMEGEAKCRACGQALTPAHLAEEVGRRTAARDGARRRAQTDESARLSVEREHHELAEQLKEVAAERQLRRDDYQHLKSRIEQCGKEIARLQEESSEALGELLTPFHARIALPDSGEWENTTYPTPTDLAALENAVAGLDAARRQLKKLGDMNAQAEPKRARVDAIGKTIDDLTSQLPKPADDLRKQDIRTKADSETLKGRITARRAQLTDLERDFDRLTRDHGCHQSAASGLAAQLSAENARLTFRRKALADALRALPDDWRPLVERAKLADQHVWKSERDALIGRNSAQRADELRIARGMVAELQASESETAKLIDAIAPSARRPVAEIQTAIRDAKHAAEAAESTLRAAQATLQELDHRQRHRQSLIEQSLSLDLEHARHSKLAELLSRDRLQGTLIRRAERQIVEHANVILDRLSSGQLFLQIRGGAEPESALDLVSVNRASRSSMIPVAFLSGSQRFRVSVSLALGIGRYACGQHRPIESVIIDEGFGCLDSNGRQAMIQELQTLRGFLKRILLVSHQEEFSEAFPDGYRFELVDGATRVTRFHR